MNSLYVLFHDGDISYYKIGKHKGDDGKLMSRYRTHSSKKYTLVAFYPEFGHLESCVHNHLFAYRLINSDTGRLTEWFKCGIDRILFVIAKLIASDIGIKKSGLGQGEDCSDYEKFVDNPVFNGTVIDPLKYDITIKSKHFPKRKYHNFESVEVDDKDVFLEEICEDESETIDEILELDFENQLKDNLCEMSKCNEVDIDGTAQKIEIIEDPNKYNLIESTMEEFGLKELSCDLSIKNTDNSIQNIAQSIQCVDVISTNENIISTKIAEDSQSVVKNKKTTKTSKPRVTSTKTKKVSKNKIFTSPNFIKSKKDSNEITKSVKKKSKLKEIVEPVKVEPVKVEPVKVEPVKVEPVKTDFETTKEKSSGLSKLANYRVDFSNKSYFRCEKPL